MAGYRLSKDLAVLTLMLMGWVIRTKTGKTMDMEIGKWQYKFLRED